MRGRGLPSSLRCSARVRAGRAAAVPSPVPSRNGPARRRFATAVAHRLFYPSRFALWVCLFFAVLVPILWPLASFEAQPLWGSDATLLFRDAGDGSVERLSTYPDTPPMDAVDWMIWLEARRNRRPGALEYTCEAETIGISLLMDSEPAVPAAPGIPQHLRDPVGEAASRLVGADPIFLDMIRTGQTARTVRTPYWWLEIPARVLAPALPALLCLIFLIRGVRRELVRRRLRRCQSGRCPACNYPTRDLAADRCPECGTMLAEARAEAERIIHGRRGEAEAEAQQATSPEDSPQMRYR